MSRELFQTALEFCHDLLAEWEWKKGEMAGLGEEYNELAEFISTLNHEIVKPLPKPVSYQYLYNGTWHDFINEDHYKNTVEDGRWPIRALYTSAPEQKPLSDEELSRLEKLERICEGLTQDHIDGGFTVTGLSKYAKGLEEDIKRLKADNQNLIDRNSLLRQRPDLPVDRITAHERLVELQETRQPLSNDEIEEIYKNWNPGIGVNYQTNFARMIERAHGITDPEQYKPQSNAI